VAEDALDIVGDNTPETNPRVFEDSVGTNVDVGATTDVNTVVVPAKMVVSDSVDVGLEDSAPGNVGDTVRSADRNVDVVPLVIFTDSRVLADISGATANDVTAARVTVDPAIMVFIVAVAGTAVNVMVDPAISVVIVSFILGIDEMPADAVSAVIVMVEPDMIVVVVEGSVESRSLYYFSNRIGADKKIGRSKNKCTNPF
jgi:hypothetical protein